MFQDYRLSDVRSIVLTALLIIMSARLCRGVSIALHNWVNELQYPFFQIMFMLQPPFTFSFNTFGSIIFAPLVETWLFLYLPFRFLPQVQARLLIISSAILFGAFHVPSLGGYAFGYTTIAGVLFGYQYWQLLQQSGHRKAFEVVMLTHALYNFSVHFI